jgi:hypothetical protein
MASRFGMTGSSERPTLGYDVTSPFMSGLKENLSSIVPLALNATALKMDEEKAQAILGTRKEELSRQLEKTKFDNTVKQIQLGISAGLPEMIKGLETTGDLQKVTGMPQWPRLMKNERASAEDELRTVATDQLQMPMSAEDKVALIQGNINARTDARDAARSADLDTRLAAQSANLDKSLAAHVRVAGGNATKENWSYFGTNEEGKPLLLNSKTGETKVGDIEGKVKPKPTDKAKKTSLRDALAPGGDTSTVAADLEKELPASQNSGKFATDPVTKARFQSDGTKWNVVK